MIRLNALQRDWFSVKKRKRVGRGIGSGKGKTCGRGHKGQKSRSGVAIKSFEGGQMPIYMRLPKRGFTKFNKVRYECINLYKIQELIDAGRVNAGDKLSKEDLKNFGLIRKSDAPVKLLAGGELSSSIKIEADKFSKAAEAEIKKTGGEIITIG